MKHGFKLKVFGKKIAAATKRKLLSKENSRFRAKFLFFMAVISLPLLMVTCIYSQSFCWFMGIQVCHSPPPCMHFRQLLFFFTMKS